MKISDKVFKRCNLACLCLPLVYITISDCFNIDINRNTKFCGVVVICTANMLVGIVYNLANKPIKKKDLIGLILAILLILWYIRFVY